MSAEAISRGSLPCSPSWLSVGADGATNAVKGAPPPLAPAGCCCQGLGALACSGLGLLRDRQQHQASVMPYTYAQPSSKFCRNPGAARHTRAENAFGSCYGDAGGWCFCA